MSTENKRSVLGKDTLIPLGFVVAICGGVVWISTQLTNINYKLDLLETKLETITNTKTIRLLEVYKDATNGGYSYALIVDA